MQILREAESEGMLNTCRNFELSQALFYLWKHQFEHKGKDGLLPQYKTIDLELRAIQQENERLKRNVADQALELAVKTELLKNGTDAHARKMTVEKFKDKVISSRLLAWYSEHI